MPRNCLHSTPTPAHDTPTLPQYSNTPTYLHHFVCSSNCFSLLFHPTRSSSKANGPCCDCIHTLSNTPIHTSALFSSQAVVSHLGFAPFHDDRLLPTAATYPPNLHLDHLCFCAISCFHSHSNALFSLKATVFIAAPTLVLPLSIEAIASIRTTTLYSRMIDFTRSIAS